MSQDNQEKNLNTLPDAEQNIKNDLDFIPTQYKNLPSEIVEQLWQKPLLINGQPDQVEAEKRKLVIEKIKLLEIDREKQKNELMQNKYLGLTDEQKLKFSKAQIESADIINQYLQNQQTIDNLLPEENYVLQKLKNSYEEFKKNNHDKSFAFDFSQDLDKNIYQNLIQKLSFNILQTHLKNQDLEKANAIRNQLGLPKQTVLPTDSSETLSNEQQNQNFFEDKDFQDFSVKNGETDIGVFWYEYRNTAAKKLKDSGKLEWGKERIYFDVPLDKIEELKNIIFDLVRREKLPIAFKHLDLQKTNSIDLKPESQTTRFVTNFASVTDAKKFYQAIKQVENYKQIQSDRNMDYHGYKIDNLAHYASGYREKREPLLRIINTAQKNSDNSYSYTSADGSKKITISQEQYNDFVNQFNSLPDPEKTWNETSI